MNRFLPSIIRAAARPATLVRPYRLVPHLHPISFVTRHPPTALNLSRSVVTALPRLRIDKTTPQKERRDRETDFQFSWDVLSAVFAVVCVLEVFTWFTPKVMYLEYDPILDEEIKRNVKENCKEAMLTNLEALKFSRQTCEAFVAHAEQHGEKDAKEGFLQIVQELRVVQQNLEDELRSYGWEPRAAIEAATTTEDERGPATAVAPQESKPASGKDEKTPPLISAEAKSESKQPKSVAKEARKRNKQSRFVHRHSGDRRKRPIAEDHHDSSSDGSISHKDERALPAVEEDDTKKNERVSVIAQHDVQDAGTTSAEDNSPHSEDASLISVEEIGHHTGKETTFDHDHRQDLVENVRDQNQQLVSKTIAHGDLSAA